MQDIAITLIVIIIAAILLFVFPLLATAENKNEVDLAYVQSSATEFVNSSATKGIITIESMDTLKQKLATTGNTYDVNLEVSRKTDDVGKKTSWTTGTNLGEGAFFTLQGTQINEQLEKTGQFKLNTGDTLTVKVENSNVTMASSLKSAILGVTDSSKSEITATASALVTGTR